MEDGALAPERRLALAVDERILIVLLGALGDVCRALSILPPLKRQMPKAQVAWTIHPGLAPLLEGHPLIDRLIPFPIGRGSRQALGEVKAFAPSCVFDLQRILKSGIIARLSGARRRIGFHRSDSKEGNWLLQTESIDAQPEALPKIDHYHRFLHQVGVASQRPYTFQVDHLRHLPLDMSFARGQSLVGLVLGSRWESKNWVQEGYEQLMRRILAEEGWHIVLLGDRSQNPLSTKLIHSVGGERVTNLVGKTTLPQLATVISKCLVLLGPDSGPGHLASALSVPHVTLFGPTPPARVAPYGSESLSLLPIVPCAPCERRVCPGLDRICMRLHKVDDALQAMRRAVRAHEGNSFVPAPD